MYKGKSRELLYRKGYYFERLKDILGERKEITIFLALMV